MKTYEIHPDRLALVMPAFGFAFYLGLIAVLMWYSTLK